MSMNVLTNPTFICQHVHQQTQYNRHFTCNATGNKSLTFSLLWSLSHLTHSRQSSLVEWPLTQWIQVPVPPWSFTTWHCFKQQTSLHSYCVTKYDSPDVTYFVGEQKHDRKKNCISRCCADMTVVHSKTHVTVREKRQWSLPCLEQLCRHRKTR